MDTEIKIVAGGVGAANGSVGGGRETNSTSSATSTAKKMDEMEVDPPTVVPSSEKSHEEIYYDPEDEVVVEDCCPQIFYKKFSMCSGDPTSPFWQVWSKHRLLGSRSVSLIPFL